MSGKSEVSFLREKAEWSYTWDGQSLKGGEDWIAFSPNSALKIVTTSEEECVIGIDKGAAKMKAFDDDRGCVGFRRVSVITWNEDAKRLGSGKAVVTIKHPHNPGESLVLNLRLCLGECKRGAEQVLGPVAGAMDMLIIPQSNDEPYYEFIAALQQNFSERFVHRLDVFRKLNRLSEEFIDRIEAFRKRNRPNTTDGTSVSHEPRLPTTLVEDTGIN